MVNFEFLNSLSESLDDPVIQLCLVICSVLSFLTWVSSVINDNYSQVDRLWSIAPVIYAWTITGYTIYKLDNYNSRLIVSTILITLWGIRLTFNFSRKGGYVPGGEDYRWPFIRQYIHPITFQIFNVFFISIYQNLLLLLITSPIIVVYLNKSSSELNYIDLIATVLFVICLIGETIADEQQWQYQCIKKKLEKHKKENFGFLTDGLFKYSRHPNYFFEISLWWAVYIFSAASDAELSWFNFSITGAVLLTLLFQGSTHLTEYISSRKYPEYEIYQKNVSRIIPWFSTDNWIKINSKRNF